MNKSGLSPFMPTVLFFAIFFMISGLFLFWACEPVMPCLMPYAFDAFLHLLLLFPILQIVAFLLFEDKIATSEINTLMSMFCVAVMSACIAVLYCSLIMRPWEYGGARNFYDYDWFEMISEYQFRYKVMWGLRPVFSGMAVHSALTTPNVNLKSDPFSGSVAQNFGGTNAQNSQYQNR